MMKKTLLASAVASVLAGTVALTGNAIADKGGFGFKALDESANSADWNTAAPWKLPKGFTQTVVSDESDLNVYPNGQTDWHDMNVVNETGPQAGRFMYRTHELRSQPGAVSVIDLETGETKLLAQDAEYDALDGIRWTPWGTVLFAEETTGGLMYEMELNEDMMSVAAIHERPAVGLMAHEGIDLDMDGNVYVVDEHRGRTSGCDINGAKVAPCGGGVYKFVPNAYGDLSAGDLYALKVSGHDGTGQAEWVGPIDASDVRASGALMGAQSYQRPEDLEIIGDVLYVAVTEGPREAKTNPATGALSFKDENGDRYKEMYEGRVIAVNLKTMKVSNFVKAGMNVPVEIGKPGQEGHQTGFDSVDNLAEAPNGDLIMIEDNKPSDIWFASTKKVNKFGASRKVKLFASLTDPGAEGTGIYFSPQDPNTLYVNIQHSAAPDGDGTWAITRKKGEKDDQDDK